MLRRRAVLLVTAVAFLGGVTLMSGQSGAVDSAHPLDPSFWGAGIADSPSCHRWSWHMQSPC